MCAQVVIKENSSISLNKNEVIKEIVASTGGDKALNEQIRSLNLSSEQLIALQELVRNNQKNVELPKDVKSVSIREFESLNFSDFKTKISSLGRNEQIALLATMRDKDFARLDQAKQDFLSTIENQDISFTLKVRRAAFAHVKQQLDSKASGLDYNLKVAEEELKNNILPSFLSSSTAASEASMQSIKLLKDAYAKIISQIDEDQKLAVNSLTVAKFIKDLANNENDPQKLSQINNVVDHLQKQALYRTDLENYKNQHQDKFAKAYEKEKSAAEAYRRSTKNWEMAETTTRLSRDSLFRSVCYVGGVAFAPLLAGAFGTTALGLFATTLACYVIGNRAGYFFSAGATYLENKFGGQNKNIHQEALVFGHGCGASAVGGGAFGVLSKYFFAIKAHPGIGQERMLKYANSYLSGAGAGLVQGGVESLIEGIYYFNAFHKLANENRWSPQKREEEWTAFAKARGLTFENILGKSIIYGLVSGMFSIQGVRLGETREAIKPFSGKLIHFLGEQGIIFGELFCLSKLLFSDQIRENPEEFYPNLASIMITSSTISSVASLPINVALPKIKIPLFLRRPVVVEKPVEAAPIVLEPVSRAKPKFNDGIDRRSPLSASAREKVIKLTPASERAPEKFNLNSLPESEQVVINSLIQGEEMALTSQQVTGLLGKVTNISSVSSGGTIRFKFSGKTASVSTTSDKPLRANQLGPIRALLKEAVDPNHAN